MRAKEFLSEMNAIAVYGDWKKDKNSLGLLSSVVLSNYYTKLSDISIRGSKKLELYKIENQHYYIAGYFVEKDGSKRFDILLKITLSPLSSFGSMINVSNLFNVDEVEVKKNMRGLGIALSFYKYFITIMNYSLLGDEYQFFGAKRLWARLSTEANIKVSIMTYPEGKFLEHDTMIGHGEEDWQFDDRVWSYDTDKQNIRLLATKR